MALRGRIVQAVIVRVRLNWPGKLDWCGRPDLNRHGKLLPRDFKSLASTISPRPRTRTAITCSAGTDIQNASAKWTACQQRPLAPTGGAAISLLLVLRRVLRRRADIAPGIYGGLFFRDLVHRRLVILLPLLLRLELVRGQFLFVALERRQRHALRGGWPRHQG